MSAFYLFEVSQMPVDCVLWFEYNMDLPLYALWFRTQAKAKTFAKQVQKFYFFVQCFLHKSLVFIHTCTENLCKVYCMPKTPNLSDGFHIQNIKV